MNFIGTLSITSGHIPPPILHIRPGDIIVVQSPKPMNQAHMRSIQQGAKRVWPDHKIVVLADGLTLSTAREQFVEINPRNLPGSLPNS